MATRCTLVGLPGSGKSTVGRHLARRLELPFIDMDQRLEQRLGCSIRVYFELHGEEAFRDCETQLLEELAQSGESMVLSTGGGVVLREANRALLARDCAPVFYLRTAPEAIFRRLRHDSKRPLLQVANPLERLRELYRVRDPLYRAVAQYVVEARRPSVHALVAMVQMQLDLAPAPASPPA